MTTARTMSSFSLGSGGREGSDVALFYDLAAEYRGRIESGELRNGDRLPVEQELAAAHGVSIATVSRFVQLLKSEGLLYTTHAGTFVGRRPEDPRLQQEEGPEVLRCNNQPWCNNLLEVRSRQALADLFRQVGWIWRGSPQGRVFYCHACTPDILIREET